MNKYIIYITLVLFSCREEITLDLPQIDEQMVVQGSIENGFPPYIILTRNQGYFDPIDNNTFNNLFIDDAEITVWTKHSDGTIDSVYLQKLPPPFDSIPIYTDISYINSVISNPTIDIPYPFSKEGQTYHLSIKWNETNVTSKTTIPFSTNLDSIWIEKTENLSDGEHKCDIRAMYTDPDTIGNNILIRSKRTEHWVIDSINQYTNDAIIQKNDESLILVDCGPDILINGTSFETYFPRPSPQGGFPSGTYNTNRYKKYQDTTTSGKDSIYIPNDIVLLKFSQVDEASMRFWRGVVRDITSGGNPFSEPMNLPSNINGGLGIWSGYGATYYKIPIIKDTTIIQEYTPNLFEIF